jgi:predicted outer membrane repeat protein
VVNLGRPLDYGLRYASSSSEGDAVSAPTLSKYTMQITCYGCYDYTLYFDVSYVRASYTAPQWMSLDRLALTIKNLTVSLFGSLLNQGGAIAVYGDGDSEDDSERDTATACAVTLQDMRFLQNVAYQGGAIYIEHCQQPVAAADGNRVIIRNIQFEDSFARRDGGAMYLVQSSGVHLQNVSIERSASLSSYGATIHIDHGQNISMDTIRIRETRGGAIQLYATHYTRMRRITVESVKAIEGAMLFFSTFSTYLEDLTMVEIESVLGGNLYLSETYQTVIRHVRASNVQANEGSLFEATHNDFLSLSDVFIINATTHHQGCLSVHYGYAMLVKNVTATNVQTDGDGALVYLHETVFSVFEQIHMRETQAPLQTGGIISVTSSSDLHWKEITSYLGKGSTLRLTHARHIQIDALHIERHTAYYGGGLYLSHSQNITFQNLSIAHCEATYGGATYVKTANLSQFADYE